MKQKEEDDQEVVRKSAPMFPFQFSQFPSVSGPGLIPKGPGLIPQLPATLQHPLIPKPIAPPVTPPSAKLKEKSSPKEKESPKVKDQEPATPSITIKPPSSEPLGEGKKDKGEHIKKDKNKHKKKDKEKIKKKKDKKDKDKCKNKEKDKDKKEKKNPSKKEITYIPFKIRKSPKPKKATLDIGSDL
uniref:Uncharacterized protein n=1 Tax=Cacopsylla melanoneura TaxID=428564 RepID=A0A8D8WCD3_9HEMI